MSKTVYPKGIVLFKPHANAPEFVKGVMKIDMKTLTAFCRENPDLMGEYKGNPQLPLQLLDGNDGLYLTVDTFKPSGDKSTPTPPPEDDEPLPF